MQAVGPIQPTAGGPTELRWPSVFMIGLAKAGTSAVHDCLTSDVFAAQACCVGAKELRLFRFGSSREPNATEVLEQLGRTQRQWRGRGPSAATRPEWPTRARPGGFRHVLDFTPGYLPDARTPTLLRHVYGEEASARLRFVVLLRDPAARTRSHFCMAARNLKQLKAIFATPGTCTSHPSLCAHGRRTCDGFKRQVSSTRRGGLRGYERTSWEGRCVNDTGFRTECVRRVGLRINRTVCKHKREWQYVDLLRCRVPHASHPA